MEEHSECNQGDDAQNSSVSTQNAMPSMEFQARILNILVRSWSRGRGKAAKTEK